MMRIGILGTGWMLGKYVEAIRLTDSASLVAVASRDAGRAATAAGQHGISRAHPSYESLIGDPEIDIVINALHNGLHCEWSVRALAAGKHVLCEKPLACSSAEVQQMFAAAHANQRWLMEAFMYRFQPQMAEAKRRIEAGEIGRVLHIHSTRTAYGRPHDNPRYWRNAGGGALMDIGCYCVNLVRFFADVEPKRVEAQAHFDPAPSGTGDSTGVDLTLSGSLQFDGGITAEFVCSMEAEPSYASEIVGTEGKLMIPHCWLPPTWPAEFHLTHQGKTQTISVDLPPHLNPPNTAPTPYPSQEGTRQAIPLPRRGAGVGVGPVLLPFALEIDHFCRCVQENRAPQFPSGGDAEQDARGNMRAIEALLASARNGQIIRLIP